MKKILLFVVSALFASTTFAQLPDGSIAPDFTTTDINGNSINLYSYLDSGYTVILDVSAVWCGPCWNYHNGGALEDLWENHGPAGEPGVATTTTDDIIVLWVEGDGSTPASSIQGGGNSLGDWTNGGTVHYPIIDDANIASLYEIGYYPTIYTICPRRTVVESGSQNTTYNNAQQQCPPATQGLNASILAYTGQNNICGSDAELNVSVDVQNFGTNPITSFDIEVIENGNVIATDSYSGTLNTYDITNIDFGSVNVTTGSIEVVITTSDADANDNAITETINFAEQTYYSVEVSLLSDDFANEIYLEIVDESGNVIWTEGNEAIAGNYGTSSQNVPADPTNPLTNNTQYNWNVPITSAGCFTLYVNDFYGDGLGASQWGGTDGDWDLKDNNGDVIAEAFVADYGATDMGMFENMAASVGINNLVQNNLTIFPNPVNNIAKIDFNLEENAVVKTSIVNMLGETVITEMYNFSAGNRQIDLDVTDVTSGVYFIQLEMNGQTTTQKITITK